jgi:BirA family transcriptional regulator, biotin operon repressor / biotin---[acetyl-CoA-carboxylase] ligase
MQGFYYKELDSTQDEAKRLIEHGNKDFYVVAQHQTNSRGTRGKIWHSEMNKGLYLSWVADLDHNIYENNNDITGFCSDLTLNIAKILRETLLEYFVDSDLSKIYIKPINDLYFDNKKLAGILVEHIIFQDISFIIVGIGLNLKKINYQDEKISAISLEEIVNLDLKIDDFFGLLNLKLKELLV